MSESGSKPTWQPGWILQPGQVLVGNYEVQRMAGTPGGMGQVFVAEDIALGLPVAIKVPALNILMAPQGANKFLREARIAARIGPHPNIVQIRACLTDPELRIPVSGPVSGSAKDVAVPFIVMEYLGGGDLSARLKSGPLPLDTARALFEKMCAAIQCAHVQPYKDGGKMLRGVVHRDLKPQNICFDEQGRLVVVDFGLARLLEDPHSSGGMVGTPSYMAPEQWSPARGVDHRTDIYALGVMLYYMVTGELPFTGAAIEELMSAHLFEAAPDARRLRPELPEAVADAIRRAMEKEKEARFDSAAQFAATVNDGFPGQSLGGLGDNDPEAMAGTLIWEPAAELSPSGIARLPSAEGGDWRLETASLDAAVKAPPAAPPAAARAPTRAQTRAQGTSPSQARPSEAPSPSETQRPARMANTWVKLDTRNAPGGRFEHSAVWDATARRMYVFGGRDTVKPLGDLWAFAPENNGWERLAPSDSGAAAGTAGGPPARYGHSVEWDAATRRMYVFGGQGEGAALADLWVYSAAENSWQSLPATGAVPAGRCGHSVVWVAADRRMYVFGGSAGYLGAALNDLSIFNAADNSWMLLQSLRIRLKPYSYHSAVWDEPTRRMLVFGGLSQRNYSNEIVVYEPDIDTWSKQAVAGALPPGRWRHSVAWDAATRSMYVLGGSGAGAIFNDLWVYRVEANAWTPLVPTGKVPLPRGDQSAVLDPDTSTIYLFGGYSQTAGTTNDLWAYCAGRRNDL